MENESPAVEETQDQAFASAESAERRGSSLPLILAMVAVGIWFAFQTIQLVVERSHLSDLNANFKSAAQESQKMQGQVQALITKTAELANQGNSAAKATVEELEKRGIPIRGAAAQPAK